MGARPWSADVVRLGRLRLARDLLDRDWSRPLDLDRLARHAGYSKYHFVRAFAAAYGETPGQYLTRRRVERAQDLLRAGDRTVTEICTLVGFGSLGTFCTRFKELTGLTPGAFRRAARSSGVPPVPACFVQMWGGGFAAGSATSKKPAPPLAS
ncbi:helix-turn-helix transcriptional regulator [Actinocatenispora rupis]|uniref:Transcriptional regulator n=1 Tax=Actinocatenispora rupis TaxID=519421 RepID=A0A8J3J032_9ACTN|nr:helix-turn-helix transcriptional regulator [Actinocatenispora rupis]GID09482.1 transcriptional regulator [Actinocatenispora rupis]